MDLVYLVAAGKRRFFWAAATAIRCLRGPAGFMGKIIVLTDRPARMPGEAEVRVMDDERCRAQPKWMKVCAPAAIDFKEYDRVSFLDSDIVVRSSLDAYLSQCETERCLVATDDLQHTVDIGMCSRCLTDSELAEHSGTTMGVNSGWWCAPGALLTNWLDEWRAILEASEGKAGQGFDQPGLNAAMVRGIIPVQRVDGLMWFPGRDPNGERANPDAPLVHYHGIGRHLNRYWRMRRFAKQACR